MSGPTSRCPACDGTGCPDYAGFAMDRCERCGGSGRLRDHIADAGNMVATPKTRAGAGAVGPCGSAECARECAYWEEGTTHQCVPAARAGWVEGRRPGGCALLGWRTIDTGPLPESPPRGPLGLTEAEERVLDEELARDPAIAASLAEWGRTSGPILPVVDPVVEAVQADLAARSARGMAKYGKTLARTDLTRAEWERNFYEELADALLYLKRLEMEGEG